ncbi:hypothetical protein CHH72_16435 [Shouchella clausii]|uniref:Uncharacterized protein n=1 Tax=Shouchella clausii TaxID=79880 RepID=A0A268NWM2_SHOCL|nr:hypothetical protein CHH72_16435 [Shouchella clausii]
MYSAPVNAPNRADSSGSWAAFRAGVRTRSCPKKGGKGRCQKGGRDAESHRSGRQKKRKQERDIRQTAWADRGGCMTKKEGLYTQSVR